jgi:UDP-glucose 4-epimerase
VGYPGGDEANGAWARAFVPPGPGYGKRMRVVVIGASGNIGTATLEALLEHSSVTEIVAVARRLPGDDLRSREPRVRWRSADIGRDELDSLLEGAGAVVHLAWIFQPSHRPEQTWANNVIGSVRLFEAVERCRVPALVVSSSVAAYSPRTSADPVDESWPTHGTSSAAYTREKAYVERLLDGLEARVPDCRVVRMRPAFVFQERAASEQRRIFAGPLLPGSLVRPGLIPVLPVPAGLLLQTVHADDIGRAFASAVVSGATGAFNLCADEVLDGSDLAAVLDARPVVVPPAVVKAALRAAWRTHAVPAPPDLFDALMRLPVMSNEHAKVTLGWQPRVSAADAIREFLKGLQGGAGYPTPPLHAKTGGPLRAKEFATGVGQHD